jgi:hypothetical protein
VLIEDALSTRSAGRRREPVETALLLVACVGLVAGVALRVGDPLLGYSVTGAVAGLADQLRTTAPAAILASAALLLDLAAGALVLRWFRRTPFASVSDALLGAYAGAVVLDVVLLAILAPAGLFRQWALGIALAAIVIVGSRTGRPLVVPAWRPGRPRPARWLLVILVWSTVVIVVLASPVVPFVDELPNHVAPAEHLRVFGTIGSLATYPSPVYGPSRLFLGYEALMGTLATLTGLPAVLAVEASVIGLAIVSAVAAWRLAAAAFGREAGFWALLAFALTFSFARLPDARDSVVALPLAAFAFAVLVGPERQLRRLRPAPGRPDWLVAAALTAATLLHPLVGALTVASVILFVLGDPGRNADRVIPAIVATAIAALPQLGVMLGMALPPVTAVLAFLAAAIGALVTARVTGRLGLERIGTRTATVALGAAGGVCLAGVMLVAPSILAQALRWLNPAFPALFIAATLAIIGFVPTARGGRRVVVAAIAAGGVSLIVVAAIPGASLSVQSLRYEVPKAVGYWLPWACVPAAAGLAASMARWRGHTLVRVGALGAVLAVLLLPLGRATVDSVQASHAVADDVAYDLRLAQDGYWQGYPDPHRLLGPADEQLLDVLRSEIGAGRIGPSTQLLHIAQSYQPWASIPIAPFSGIDETVVSADATTTIFTAGGRILPLADLPAELDGGFGYVVLEPAGLPTGIDSAVVAAGYRPIYRNGAGEVFVALSGKAGGGRGP